MADPVSWLMIEPGWRVTDADGDEVGRVLEVAGDSNVDIFDGLVLTQGALGKPRYVPSEQVGEIVEGRVQLQLARAAIEALPVYKEPAAEEEIEPEKASVAARAEGAVVEPHAHPTNIPFLRRILLWFGLTGRR